MEELFPGFEERRVETFGAEINLRVGGSGPPLVLLHGYPQTHACWHGVAARLADRFTLVLPDLRGYGKSSCPTNDPDNFTYSKRAMAQDILQVMHKLGFERFGVVGHDRGARVAYRLALDEPAAISGLAVLDIVPTLETWESMKGAGAAAMGAYHWLFLAQPFPLPEMLIEQRATEFLDYTLASWSGTKDLSPFNAVALASYRLAFSIPPHIHATCCDYRAGQTYDLEADKVDRAAGRKVQCPVVSLWGNKGFAAEGGTPVDVWRQWADDVEGFPLPCGHFLPEERSDDVADHLLAFFQADETA
ncbi:haloacetate dehalogenase [Rhodoligotrophos appendicifer]|uniref:alpha/beta fold hydrolase n=1 Tax=Rhodoligotrophos appendicifer TaxID=987056 RepID=UPI001185AAED|nr:alpha/beta hydrolase [Rhodoligotrophos appendicifer]